MDMRSVRGLAEANARLDFLPTAAKEQMGVEVGLIARDVLAAQRRDVAKDTGLLRGALTVQLQIERLRARVGLLGKNGRGAGRRIGHAFYGRFVEFGRRAQTVVVTRGAKRRVRGNGRTTARTVTYDTAPVARLRRRGPNKGTPIGSPYKMRVSALSARPFVRVDRPEHDYQQRLAAFWAGLMARGWGS
ncbi:hypothetical protein [Sphingomonas sp. IW22]|uniref:hypothetical protein n=1 Tax=Sphingomonas sp. IW22 TaxID=3242489 RepID=UPI0035225951